MWVKICGIKTGEAAEVAAAVGADALGFIFARGRRQVSPEQAQRLIAGLPPEIPKVGVFVNQASERIRQIAAHAGLTHVQLHADEPPEALDAVGLPVIKAFRIKCVEDLHRLPAYRGAAGLLLDPYIPGQPGGTGQTLDWDMVPRAVAVLQEAGVPLAGPGDELTPGRPRLILAGGLTPDNVAKAIRQAHPGGVDVSSGVETDGTKDSNKIQMFLQNAKGALR